MPTVKELQHATELARLIGRVSRLNRGRVRKGLAEHGQSLHDWQVIANVKWQGPMTQVALAEHIGAHTATLSRLLDSLEKKGLIQRKANAADRRCVKLHLTRKGDGWYGQWNRIAMGQLHEVMSGLGAGEQELLGRLLSKLLGLVPGG
ncbi:MAG: MarR family transcriptional regulator [Archangiaceae bacterium]|nr:MarR family transcriptional regulator [Archangiaceae bacterium]